MRKQGGQLGGYCGNPGEEKTEIRTRLGVVEMMGGGQILGIFSRQSSKD